MQNFINKPVTYSQIAAKLASVLIVVCMISQWRVANLFTQSANFPYIIYLYLLPTLFFLFNSLCAFGLWFMKPWSFGLTYLTVILSTISLSANYLPILSPLLTGIINKPGVPTILVNILFLLGIVVLHQYSNKNYS